MFDAFYDVEEKMKKGNPYAKKVPIGPSAHQLPHQLRFVGEMLKFVVSGHGILGECRVVHESSRGARQSLQLRILVSCLDTLTPFWSGSLCLDQLISVII